MVKEHVLKSRLRDLTRGAAAQEAHIRLVDLQLLSAEQAFTRLRKVSGLKSTAAVVAAFVANEDENFSLFNFIQETNDEVTRQQETVEKLQKDMRRFKKEKWPLEADPGNITSRQSRPYRISKSFHRGGG